MYVRFNAQKVGFLGGCMPFIGLNGGDGIKWAEPALEDDLVSMDGSDDEQVPEQPEFNAKSDIRNVVLKKEMKFPNAKVFRAALREYAIKKPVDIKFKLNEWTKISVHGKNECGWRCYAS